MDELRSQLQRAQEAEASARRGHQQALASAASKHTEELAEAQNEVAEMREIIDQLQQVGTSSPPPPNTDTDTQPSPCVLLSTNITDAWMDGWIEWIEWINPK